MQDRDLYQRILGIESPWYVESVNLKMGVGEVQIARPSTRAPMAAPGYLSIPDDRARRTAKE